MFKVANITWKQNKKVILNNINMEIGKGECIGLVGPNGSGKSSLLKIMALLEAPTSGEIFYQDQKISSPIPLAMRRKIAIVFQEPLLFDMNVYQNVAAGLKIRRLPKAQIDKTVRYWLETLKISDIAKQQARSLSGGEAQRVSLARSFAVDPEMLFLDEPFSSLDAPTIEKLLLDLKGIFQSTGVTALIVSHHFREIKSLTSRMYVMLKGEIASSGATDEVLAHFQSTEAKKLLAPWEK